MDRVKPGDVVRIVSAGAPWFYEEYIGNTATVISTIETLANGPVAIVKIGTDTWFTTFRIQQIHLKKIDPTGCIVRNGRMELDE